jgi:hypothetical protein
MKTKKCSKCLILKEPTDFSINRATKDWRSYECSACRKQYLINKKIQQRLRIEEIEWWAERTPSELASLEPRECWQEYMKRVRTSLKEEMEENIHTSLSSCLVTN